MATSTLVQYLETGMSGATMAKRQTETFIAGGTIAAGAVVSLDDIHATDSDRAITVISSGAPVAIGSALYDAAAGEKVEVVIKGYAEGVTAVAGSKGDPLGSDSGGGLTTVAGGATFLNAVALENVAAGKCDVFWL